MSRLLRRVAGLTFCHRWPVRRCTGAEEGACNPSKYGFVPPIHDDCSAQPRPRSMSPLSKENGQSNTPILRRRSLATAPRSKILARDDARSRARSLLAAAGSPGNLERASFLGSLTSSCVYHPHCLCSKGARISHFLTVSHDIFFGKSPDRLQT